MMRESGTGSGPARLKMPRMPGMSASSMARTTSAWWMTCTIGSKPRTVRMGLRRRKFDGALCTLPEDVHRPQDDRLGLGELPEEALREHVDLDEIADVAEVLPAEERRVLGEELRVARLRAVDVRAREDDELGHAGTARRTRGASLKPATFHEWCSAAEARGSCMTPRWTTASMSPARKTSLSFLRRMSTCACSMSFGLSGNGAAVDADDAAARGGARARAACRGGRRCR